jgi:flavin-dependent dehydrogenase
MMIKDLKRVDRYDTVIVGARCAGAALAMLLARSGQKVLALDKMPYGTDTLSSHALMRSAVTRLSRWGLLDALSATGAPLIDATTFHYGADKIRVEIKKSEGVPGLIAPRRYVLDALLADAARDAGAEVHHETSVTGICAAAAGIGSEITFVNGAGQRRTVWSHFVVGADGANSFVARSFQVPTKVQGNRAAAHIYGYVPWVGSEYHWYFKPGASASLIPTNNGEACLVASVPSSQFESAMRPSLMNGWARVIERVAPDLTDLAGRVAQPLRAFRGHPGFIRQGYGRGWALVGDAGFFRDPLTAHGISDALRDAEGLAEALINTCKSALAERELVRLSIINDILQTTDAIAGFDWSLAELPALHKSFSEAMKLDFSNADFRDPVIGHDGGQKKYDASRHRPSA